MCYTPSVRTAYKGKVEELLSKKRCTLAESKSRDTEIGDYTQVSSHL